MGVQRWADQRWAIKRPPLQKAIEIQRSKFVDAVVAAVQKLHTDAPWGRVAPQVSAALKVVDKNVRGEDHDADNGV